MIQEILIAKFVSLNPGARTAPYTANYAAAYAFPRVELFFAKIDCLVERENVTMRSCVAIALFFVAFTNPAICKEGSKLVSENRVPTELGFYDALTRAKKIIEGIGEMSSAERREWFAAEKFVRIQGYKSQLGFGSVKDGLYTYIWAQDPSGKCQIFGQVVEFYSGGLWFQVTTKSIYRYDLATKRYTELSPQFSSDEYPFLDTLPFIDRNFDIVKLAPKTEAAECSRPVK
ncbi:MAG: hypothetical protein IT422_24395 [Pirellulaceae bacterium]|nr:hypothetical protein [Pirellulaceae bacterium]